MVSYQKEKGDCMKGRLVALVCIIVFLIGTIFVIKQCNKKTYLEMETAFISCIQTSFVEQGINMKDTADKKVVESIITSCKAEEIE